MRAAGKSGQAGSAWRRGIVKGDKLSPLTEVLIRGNWNLREICETAVRHLENIKNSEKQKSKKDSKTIRTTQPPANSTKADSEAFLPNRMRLVSLRAVNSELGSFKKMQLQQGSQIAKFHLFRKCGLLALNLASIFEKLLDQKTFCLPAVFG